MPPESERDFDVVVFGATSVTGRRVASYLAERAAESGLSWAAAARSLDKLRRVLAEEGVEAPATVAAEIGDPDSLARMAERTEVVVNLVGPYSSFGTPVIEACVSAGTHYADLTGEIPFVRRTIAAFHRRAAEARVKVVQVCGFEALPPDLGVLLAAEAAEQRYGESLAQVDVEVAVVATPAGLPRPSDFVSGGTMQSMATVTGDPDAARLTDPALLVEDEGSAAAIRARSPIALAPRLSDGAVIAPMSPAAFINPAVIHRSAVLRAEAREQPFAPFRYREGVGIRGPRLTLPLRYAVAGALSGVQAGLSAAARARPSLRERMSIGLSRVFPSSGFGPRADRLEDWRWRMTVEGTTATAGEVRIEIDAEGHPGYLATARMLGEAGILLGDASATPDQFGCLTPAAALGSISAPRFDRASLHFAVR